MTGLPPVGGPPGVLPPDQRARLLGAKLASLVSSHTGATVGDVTTFGGGAATMVGSDAWVLIDDHRVRGVGAALGWAQRHDAASLNVVTDDSGGMMARRLEAFDVPATVWTPQAGTLTAVTPQGVPPVVMPSPGELALAEASAPLGVDVVVEHGVVLLEVAGLEVGRVVTIDGTPVLTPGVGRNDRDGHATLLASDATNQDAGVAALTRVVDEVRRHRQGAAADRHPLGRMARQRWLRHHLVSHPGLVGTTGLEPVEPVVPRLSVSDPDVAVAVGTATDGSAVVVACSSGIDLEFVPGAADALGAAAARGVRNPALILVAPHRDLQPVTHRLAAALKAQPAIVAVDNDWYLHTPA